MSQRTLAWIGAALWAIGCLLGLTIQVYYELIKPLFSSNAGTILLLEMIGLCLAIPPVLVYIWVPLLIDRFDPEPWWALMMAFLWGAFAAAGISMLINTAMGTLGGAVGGQLGEAVLGASISAPVVEEATKGMMILGMFWFMRREFDGVVDGVIYGTFSALGFAMSENAMYYAMGLGQGGLEGLGVQVVLRGVLKPWGHPLYTALTGIGIGLARESPKLAVKLLAPPGFYLLAVALHATWNTSGTLGAVIGVPLIFVMLPLYFVIMLVFLGIVIWLVAREGRALRQSLEDEVHMGNLSHAELALICSPFGRMRARWGRGKQAARVVLVGTKLGMAKWHLARAARGKVGTVSIDAIVPLRQELIRLKQSSG